MKRKQQIKCPYCGAYATCRPASVVYGKSGMTKNSYLYICSRWPVCDSYVGTHKKDRRPLGTLADKKLRRKRILAHRSLEALQQHCHMKKSEVYVGLQEKLGLSEEQTHIGMFSEAMCEKTISLCNQAVVASQIRAA